MKNLYTGAELLYSAGARCACGAGLAYPLDHADAMELSAWVCSRVLLGEVEIPGGANRVRAFFSPSEHSDSAGQVHQGFPFASYSIKSEGQPSAQGASTRPAGAHVESEPHCACRDCGHEYVAARRRNDLARNNDGLDCPKCGAPYLNPGGSLSTRINAGFRTVVVSDARPDLARIAFEAYGASTGGLTWDDKPIPPFDEIRVRTPHVAAAWEAAVAAVLSATGAAR